MALWVLLQPNRSADSVEVADSNTCELCVPGVTSAFSHVQNLNLLSSILRRLLARLEREVLFFAAV